MKPQHFELRRVRDFGEIISDSFTFFKENFRDLIKPLLVICGFFIALGSISFGFMQTSMLEGIGQTSSGAVQSNVFDAPRWTTNYLLGTFMYYIVFMFYTMSVFLTTYSYIAIYKDKPAGEKPTLIEVWGYYKYYFLRTLGSNIVIVIIMCIGTVLCILPGIWIGTVLSLTIPMIIMENASFGYAFNKSFNLIKGNWWMTFGTIFIISLVIGVSSYLVSIPMLILTVSKALLKLDILLWPLVLLCGLLYNLFLLSYSLLAIAVSMCYFSYTEEKEGTGLMDRINMLGKSDDTSHLPSEEY